jgi:hypothetical protein
MKTKSKKLMLAKESVLVLDKDNLMLAAGGSLSYHCSPFPSYDPCGGGSGMKCY